MADDVVEAELSNEFWATSSDVREHIDIPQKGDDVAYREFINSATETVQAWWIESTGGSIPDDLPNADTLTGKNSLLLRATALLAASEAHESKGWDLRTQDSENSDSKHMALERRARSKFSNWEIRNGYHADGTDSDEGHPTGSSGATGSISSLIDL